MDLSRFFIRHNNPSLTMQYSRNVNKIEEFSDLQDDVRQFVGEVTKHQYSFAVASSRIWGQRIKRFGKNEDEILQYEEIDSEKDVQHGTFYQLMPDGIDDGFFDWYCEKRQDYQFFISKEMCVAYFLKFWILWKNIGKRGT
jgi:hypothetical protein